LPQLGSINPLSKGADAPQARGGIFFTPLSKGVARASEPGDLQFFVAPRNPLALRATPLDRGANPYVKGNTPLVKGGRPKARVICFTPLSKGVARRHG
jgi:hypothetical protein